MNRTHKIALVIASNMIAFILGAMVHNQKVVEAAPATHVVNGLTLSDAQFNEQLAVQKAANDKMEQDYAVTQVQEQAAYDAKVNAFVEKLAKKAQKDHGLFVPSQVRHPARAL